MNSHHLSFYIKVLENVQNKKKFIEVLGQIEESFLPYATFTNHILPLFESKIFEISKKVDTQGVDNNTWSQELKDNKKFLELGKFLEQEKQVLSQKVALVIVKNSADDNVIVKDADFRSLIKYLKDFKNKLEQEDEIIKKMLNELHLFENFLEHIIGTINNADNILEKYKEEFEHLI